jgi:uncharacterized membrane protein HdeD (DUF308 family)
VAKNAMGAGIVLILLGMAGIVFPAFMSVAVVFFVAWMMLLGGLASGWFTWMSDRSDWMGWFKAFIPVLVALMLFFKPMPGIAAVGLLLAIYFLFDSFGNMALALTMKPAPGWWMWLLNGLFSLILAVIFLVGWPFSSLVLVGLFVGISLLIDGVVLLTLGRALKRDRL